MRLQICLAIWMLLVYIAFGVYSRLESYILLLSLSCSIKCSCENRAFQPFIKLINNIINNQLQSSYCLTVYVVVLFNSREMNAGGVINYQQEAHAHHQKAT